MTTAPPGWQAGPLTEREALFQQALFQQARRRRRRRWLTVGAVIAAVAAGGIAVITGAGGGHRARPQSAPAARPAASARAPLVTVSQTRLPGDNSLSLAVGYRAVWVSGINVTYEVDQDTGRVVRTISTPGTFPDGCRSGIAAGAGAVWVTHSCRGVYRIDPHTGRVTAALRVPDAGDAIAVANGLVWVTDYHGDLLRIQPRSGRRAGKPIWVGHGGWELTPKAGALWVTSYGSGKVSRVGLATGSRSRLRNVTDIQAVGAGSLWTVQVRRVDPATGKLIASIPLPHAVQLVFWKGSAWVLSVQRSLTLTRIDPATNRVAGPPVPVGRPLSPGLDTEPSVMTAGPTGIWVLDFPRDRLFHLALP
jgi:hypothetical protein